MQATYGLLAPVCPAQEVAIGPGSLQSAAFNVATGTILLVSTVDCRYTVDVNPTALATSSLLPAGVPIPWKVPKLGTYKVAVIQESVPGKLSITELPD